MSPKYYTGKTYTPDSWKEKVTRDKQLVPGAVQDTEVAVPRLLLNYFIINAYEDASCRMAKGLGYISNNKDLLQFNSLFKITERATIVHLVKLGQISKAMEIINSNFGLEILQNENPQYSPPGSAGNDDYDNTTQGDNNIFTHNPLGERVDFEEDDDLHYKLLLLNLIEMIRNNKKKQGNEVDKEFIINLINYSKDKLAPKALKNKSHMKQLELIMTLLLIPPDLDIELPCNLNKLYSLSLRSKVATLINQKLLKSIYPDITNQTKFPNVLQSPETLDILDFKLSNFKSILRTNVKSQDLQKSATASNSSSSSTNPTSTAFSGTSLDNPTSTLTSIPISGSNDGSLRTHASSDRSLQNSLTTSKDNNLMKNMLSNNEDPLNNRDTIVIPDLQFDSKLSQIIKLWAWCENELHTNNIGVPRIQNKA
ncbi:similar to Saccharomyces cerevisiae YMR135C GID8 Protein of unknown function, involved in proteasome-dependent catabolite inactivation of fructose-1,6-bisphosphatase [Maudiozyma barnettii]|uniref:CTLH domain-containing protein n=1 Tax=Maudiozyma barnettii TaxID=61262 RepID=A0A8H2ZGC8_9SACH|nr:glucose-induced degradation complex subunit GID8 [Kazachstania barnettii]CAB4254469.1 similar to Saccharomyces cerevisiae YMR135C GID8 Protein of unknown function, involved in proteasome-dependent catabolite inactivation of fructose-1,6-bisphosphatase [Kazachstania barnettii]CAD1782449.1 similar to Saccharomyces cerevisiae YMR135C GID8 Protein of unknown function, involved in proteasome-dependent catabolite inactivation of fructose-1,6-bisphosphatase [Kazachstania barnettii]